MIFSQIQRNFGKLIFTALLSFIPVCTALLSHHVNCINGNCIKCWSFSIYSVSLWNDGFCNSWKQPYNPRFISSYVCCIEFIAGVWSFCHNVKTHLNTLGQRMYLHKILHIALYYFYCRPICTSPVAVKMYWFDPMFETQFWFPHFSYPLKK